MALLDQRPTRTCDYCGDVLHGRSDKRFCSAECRNGYHNHHSSLNDAFMRKVNAILRQNRRVLAELITDEGKASVHLDRLQDRGFNFAYFTHTYQTKEGAEYRFCYEYGYLSFKPNWYVIVRRDRNGES